TVSICVVASNSATMSPSFTGDPFGISFVSVSGPPGPKICGTSTFDECTASTIPVNLTSCLECGTSAPGEAASATVGGFGRVQDASQRTRNPMQNPRRELHMYPPRRLDVNTPQKVDTNSVPNRVNFQ